MQSTDTHGYSEMLVAVSYLIGVSFDEVLEVDVTAPRVTFTLQIMDLLKKVHLFSQPANSPLSHGRGSDLCSGIELFKSDV